MFNALSAFSWIAACVFLTNVHCSTIVAQESLGLVLEQDKAWSCISAKQESKLVFFESAEDEQRENRLALDWRLSFGNRVLVRGRTDRQKIKNRTGYVVHLDLTELELKSIVEAELLFSIEGNAVLTKKVFLFPADPFANQQRVLTEAKIHLFDPVGDTKTAFESAKIPFESIHRIEAVNSVEDALILVGEGLKPGQYLGLVDSLRAAAERGSDVIWLAASEGEIEFELKSQTRVVLEKETVIKRFDSRFDVVSWASKSPVASRWEPNQSDNYLSLKASDTSSAWPWIELHGFNDATKKTSSPGRVREAGRPSSSNSSRFVLCGLAIIERWDDGPVAKHLLLEMIRNSSNETLKN